MKVEPTFRLDMARYKIATLRLVESFPGTTVSTVVRGDRPLTSAAQRVLSCFEDVVRQFAHERGRR
ncbi:hypothetical protein GXB81_09695 [Paraburkholderia sp. Ac-20336]|uniref:hypothetical protein n=1 Tax=Paraburkholderia sp. Ac-20336 TaxID=2703886 RepID=UPI00197FF6A3|nr:hypothetical protein [Paraburkholderia sp. Ac-20336]MBN3803326.1 hypothetical protein [Paraburkholderia sp. Ac-20336]